MKIFVDGLGLPPHGGARSSMLGWLVALGQQDHRNQYEVFLSRPEPVLDRYDRIRQRIIAINSRYLLRIWAQIQLPGLIKNEKPDLFHAMKNLTVFGVPCNSILTINDLTHIVLADLFPWIDRIYWQVLQRAMLRQVDHIIAISESTKRDLVRVYGLLPSKISVIYPSCDPSFGPTRNPQQEASLQVKYGLKPPYILYVGGWAIHKNLRTLIDAFAQLRSSVPHNLVVVGGQYHTSNDVQLVRQAIRLGLEYRIQFLDRVPEVDLPHLYRMADLFVLPSLNEGFGLVMLEAMSSGTPVLSSHCGSLPEVGGDAVAWVKNPKEIGEWAEVIAALLRDSRQRERQRELGLVQARQFVWQRTAEQTLALYERVMSQ
jgi:glycosyltransferase involved in cell wall biosynthesis